MAIRNISASLNGVYDPYGKPFLVTFDFGPEQYQSFLAELSVGWQERVKVALSRQPYRIFFDGEDQPWLTVMGEIGPTTFTNPNESYRPFVAEAFVKDYPPPTPRRDP